MAADSTPSLVCLYVAEPDPGLAATVTALCPESRIESAPFRLEDWMGRFQDPRLHGVIVDADRVSLGELQALAATLHGPDRPWLLLVVGDRGVAGFETLMAHPRATVLPKPWTPQGLQHALDGLRAPAPVAREGGFPGEFLDGMVEGLRDPLSSLCGYMQLLENQGDDRTGSLVRPALKAATEISGQLEAMHMAAADLTPHPTTVDLSETARHMAEEAEDGPAVHVDAEDALRVEADPRYLRQTMEVGRLLLQRFGPGGAMRLRAHADADGVRITWEQSIPERVPDAPATAPDYLSELFHRLAERVPARAVLDTVGGVVPVAAGLRWKRKD